MHGGDCVQYKVLNDARMRNILLNISYDGKNYHGWQIQKNALSIQEVFQESLFKIIGNYPDIKGCSRTDAGVHANMYCISFKTEHNIPCKRLLAALNRYLPFDIAVNNCIDVKSDFHARYSCKGKEYIYKIWNNKVRNPFLDGYAYHYWYKIDENILNDEATSNIDVERENDMVLIRVKADGFLYNMVRIMVGTLLRVAQGKVPKNGIKEIIEQKDRTKAGPTARSCGLYLNRVFYDEVKFGDE